MGRRDGWRRGGYFIQIASSRSFVTSYSHFIQNSDRVIASSRPRTRRVRTRFAVVSFSSSHLFAVAVAEIDARLSRSRSSRVVEQTEYRREDGSTG